MCVCVLCHFYNKTEYKKGCTDCKVYEFLLNVCLNNPCLAYQTPWMPQLKTQLILVSHGNPLRFHQTAWSSDFPSLFLCLYASVFFSSGYKSCNNCSFLSVLIHNQLIVYISKQENTCLLNFLSQCT